MTQFAPRVLAPIQCPAIQMQNPIFMTSQESWLESDIFAIDITCARSAKVHPISIYLIFHFHSSQLLSCGQIKTSNYGVKEKPKKKIDI